MSKYNTKRVSPVQGTESHEGGASFTQRPEAELVGMLSAGIQNTFYEKEGEREKRFREIIGKVAKKSPTFVAKALIYARSVFGQRSITHLGAVNLLPYLSGNPLGKDFFSKRNRKKDSNDGGIIYRLDDMNEILACYFAKNGDDAAIPNAIKKGFKLAIENADTYELAKYQMKTKAVSLVDIVNLVHPVESKKNGTMEVSKDEYLKAIKGTKFAKTASEVTGDSVTIPAIKALVLGLLKQFNTVENTNTEAGKVVAAAVKAGELTKEDAVKVLTEKKADNFTELIRTKKIGYLALLRNLRNIINTNDTTLLTEACDLLVTKEFIAKSLVWPHQIDLAQEILMLETSGRTLQKVCKALDIAYENSIPNLMELLPEGRTAIVFDTSGSMQGGWSGGCKINKGGKGTSINASPEEKAALIAATFAKGVAGDVYHFGTRCERITGFNPNDSIGTMKRHFRTFNGNCGHGTSMESIFSTLYANGKYDRVVIISDEQTRDNMNTSLNKYSAKFGMPYVYHVNLCGYAATATKTNDHIFRVYGYSSDIYTKIKDFEIDINVVINAIKAINI
jgi:polyhydroxyalkanoate synthesis regulator phasin